MGEGRRRRGRGEGVNIVRKVYHVNMVSLGLAPLCTCGKQMAGKGDKECKENMLQNIKPCHSYEQLHVCGYACLCERISRHVYTDLTVNSRFDVGLRRTTKTIVSLRKTIHTRKKGNYYNRTEDRRTSQSNFNNPISQPGKFCHRSS